MKRTIAIAVLATAVAGVGTSANAGSRHVTAVLAAARPGLLARVTVTASEFKFVLSSKSARRGLVTFKVKNVGKLGHDFKIKGRKTSVLSPGQSATLRVTFLKKGHYPYICTVPGHAAAGMKGVFTIT
jgi:uncharacterized cupredoxin-like copper-binding protein